MTEIRNYLRRCTNLTFAFSAASAFTSSAYSSLLLRTLPRRMRRLQPAHVRRAREIFLATSAPAPVECVVGVLPRRSLTLTSGSLEIRDPSEWRHEFDDVERTVSLHRWNWLLRGLTDDPTPLAREDGLTLMRSWIAECLEDGALSRDVYSTGERIVNGSIFLLVTGSGALPSDIVDAFRVMGRQVAQNIEYLGPGLTGNHAFNNARAILFAGLIGDSPEAVDLAEAIARERLATLVTADGFMREGSSHYQFLFTRWILEMLWIAERHRHARFVALLTPYAARLVERCWFFLVQQPTTKRWQIPLIGDVSPDFPPEWLIGLPWTSLARRVYQPEIMPAAPEQRGWFNLFGPVEDGITLADHTSGVFPASGWFRVEQGPWTVFVRAEQIGGALMASHKHADLGSFVLFENGAPIFVDIGRLDYTLSPLSRYGRAAAGHNTILIDELGPPPDGPTWLAAGYARVKADVAVTFAGEETVVSIKHDGFRRLDETLSHERRLRLTRNRFVVEDRLEGLGARHVRTRFHFAPGAELQSAATDRKLDGSRGTFEPDPRLQAVVQVGEQDESPGGLFFPSYGREQRCHTVDLSAMSNLPVLFSHTLSAGNN
jgi:hypothetical protein